jgi:hypothetical protein
MTFQILPKTKSRVIVALVMGIILTDGNIIWAHNNLLAANLTQINLGQFSLSDRYITSISTAATTASAAASSAEIKMETKVIDTSRLPHRMPEFFTRQQEQRKPLNKTHWKKSHKYLILRCRTAGHCGGTADRIKPIPLFLRLDYETK